jgi:hypothetical protein
MLPFHPWRSVVSVAEILKPPGLAKVKDSKISQITIGYPGYLDVPMVMPRASLSSVSTQARLMTSVTPRAASSMSGNVGVSPPTTHLLPG